MVSTKIKEVINNIKQEQNEKGLNDESGEQIDLSNITIEEMLSDFGLMATLLEDNVLENMEEISQLSVKLNNLTGEKNAKVAENHEIAKLLQENKRLKEENKQIKEEKGQLIAQQELIKNNLEVLKEKEEKIKSLEGKLEDIEKLIRSGIRNLKELVSTYVETGRFMEEKMQESIRSEADSCVKIFNLTGDMVLTLEKIKTLEKELVAEQEAAQDFPNRQLSFRQLKYPDLFAELEKRMGKEEQKARFEKEEIKLQKNKQVKKEKINYQKYQKQIKNVKKLLDIRENLTKKNNVEKTNYYDTAIDLVKEKIQARKATVALKNRALEIKNDLANEQDQVNNLQNRIKIAEQDLGVSLDNLATELGGKTISDQLAHAQAEVGDYKEQLKDYKKIKQERDQLKTELNQKQNQIITKIISELKLSLNNETNLESVLDKIKELIVNKTPDTSQETEISLRQQLAEKDREIKELRKQNKENYIPPETIKQRARQTFKELGIENSVYQEKLSQITSLLELESFYQEVIKKEIGEIRGRGNKIEKLNVIFAEIFLGKERIGFLGRVQPLIVRKYQINEVVLVAQISLTKIFDYLDNYPPQFHYRLVSNFPTSTRDLSFIFPESINYSEVVKEIREVTGNNLQEVNIFDIYQSVELERERKKSVSFHLVFQSSIKTLENKEIERMLENVVEKPALVVQWIEYLTSDQRVGGSNPPERSKTEFFDYEGIFPVKNPKTGKLEGKIEIRKYSHLRLTFNSQKEINNFSRSVKKGQFYELETSWSIEQVNINEENPQIKKLARTNETATDGKPNNASWILAVVGIVILVAAFGLLWW
ncbi:16961_t:CDS:10 [Gigaspora margarita]|uniref:16961_t:CDS:1 n=1 Tax=Gigaspora margarita TaxID=4874 RepID=A0ABM8VW39_GIGMA|nr:16961_t:CDS:10 [Gigaspora margarita]